MSRALQVLKLHYIKRYMMFIVPATIMALVVIVTILIALIAQRLGVDTSSQEWIDGVKQNGGAIWSFPGFFVYLGVQAISTTFPFGMALGTTRRAYALGSAMFFIVQSAYVALLGLVLFGLEKLTHGWFVHGYVFDVLMLGNGNVGKLMLMLFSISFLALSVGAVFGALFVKAGTKGPLMLAIALVLVIAVLLLILAPQLGAIFRAATIPGIAGVLVALAAVATLGQYIGLRSASVR